MKIVAPDGHTWTVRRRWTPRWVGRGPRARLAQARGRRARRDDEDRVRWYDWLDIPFDLDGPGSFLAVVGIIIVIVVLVLWGLPLLLSVVDVILVLLALVLGTIGRIVFRRPWTVEAVRSDGETRVRHVVGWFDSGRAAQDWAEELRLGVSQ